MRSGHVMFGCLKRTLLILCLATIPGCASGNDPPAAMNVLMPRIAVAPDGRGFVLGQSQKRFVPWGFNYDRDFQSRLIEDYWDVDWPTIDSDFHEMKSIGANVVRVHLQFAKFMDAPAQPNQRALNQLDRLLRLAERE